MYSFTCKTLRQLISVIPSKSTYNVTKQLSRYSSQYFHIDDDLLDLTDENKQLRAMVFNFAQKELAPYAAKIDREDEFKNFDDFWKKMGSLGLFGVTVDTRFGGLGEDILKHLIVIEELSRASASIGTSYVIHSNFVGNQINLWGTEEQKKKYLPKICSGEIVGALAMSEVTAGSDIGSMKTTAKRDGDHYVLNGSKFWISNGSIADLIIVYAKTNPGAGLNGMTAFLVEKNFEGFSTGPNQDKLGFRGIPNSELIFEDVRVPVANRMGEENKAKNILFKGLNLERVVLSAVANGIMQAACDCAFEYVHNKEQFGQKIGEFQLMQGRLADMYVSLCSSKCYTYNVAKKICKTGDDQRESAAAFLLATENSSKVCQQAMQCLGGNGYMNDYPVARLLRDVKALEIGGGTCDIRRLTIGKSINDNYMKK